MVTFDIPMMSNQDQKFLPPVQLTSLLPIRIKLPQGTIPHNQNGTPSLIPNLVLIHCSVIYLNKFKSES